MNTEQWIKLNGAPLYVIERSDNGASRGDDITREASFASRSFPAADAFANEYEARKCLAEFITSEMYDWLTMEDEHGDEVAERHILAGGVFTDGQGRDYCVRERRFDRSFYVVDNNGDTSCHDCDWATAQFNFDAVKEDDPNDEFEYEIGNADWDPDDVIFS